METAWPGVIEHYRKYLPVTDRTPVVTLLEGNTPLIPCERISAMLKSRPKVYCKFEGLNPTSSFKDRGMTVAVSKAVEAGAKAVICASTGNTSASAAAYAARAGLEAAIVIPEGKIALGKLSQAIMHGAKVIQVEGNFDDALNIVREVSAKFAVTLVNSLNPHRLEGQKTASFEICDRLGGRAPTYHVLPVGNAGNITAYWKGYKEYHELGITDSLPTILGFQAEGAAPIVRKHRVENPETVATAIRIGNPASWEGAVRAEKESGGLIEMVSDEQILEAYQCVARTEGIFCEPASAASIAGLFMSDANGRFTPEDTIVCTLTGHGLKDPDVAMGFAVDLQSVPPKVGAVVDLLGL